MAFGGCSSLTTVNYNAINCSLDSNYIYDNYFWFDEMPESLLYTDSYHIFNGCSNITTINIGDSVLGIPPFIFYGCGITSITIPISVTSIGPMAFGNCNNLEHVHFNANHCIVSRSIQVGGYDDSYWDMINVIRAFQGCGNITTVIFGDSVSYIPDYIFMGTNIKKITIPENVISIGNKAFASCDSLQTIIFNATNCNYAGFINGYHGGRYIESSFSDCHNISKVIIGDQVTKIPPLFLINAGSIIDTLTIPNSVTNIGYSAFMDLSFNVINYNASNCSYAGENRYLDVVAMTNSFYGCNIAKVNIGNSVANIPAYLFYGCYGFDTIIIPNSVVSIDTSAFGNCIDLNTIIFNATICTNVNYPFSHNIWDDINIIEPDIQTIIIGENVSRIPIGLFYGIPNIQTIKYNATNCTYAGSYLDGFDNWYDCENAFDRIFYHYNCIVSIGESVQTIPPVIFANLNIDSITIPESVTNIGDLAFGYTNLQQITSRSFTAPTLGTNAFYDVNDSIPVIIPCGSNMSYSTNWNYFSNFLPDSTFYSFSFNSSDTLKGQVSVLETPNCSSPVAIINAIANSGYRFNHWSDHNTDNPRSLTICMDTSLFAYFTFDNSPHDTVYSLDTVYVHDTTYITQMVHDTTFINNYIHDTTYINTFVFDTLIAYVNQYVHDTTFITNYIHDTSYIYRTQYDTLFVYNTVHDTAWLTAYIHDTAFINNYIHDTVWLTQTVWDYIHDTVIEHVHHYIHDTTFVNNYIHDTTYLTQYVDRYIHDTVMQYVNQYIHDTTFINNYIHDTVINYVNNYIHDTTFINNYLHDTVWMTNYVYDTVYINNTVHDTAYITQYVHDTTFVNNYVHDTLIAYVNQYVHDTTFITNYIHDTSYIYRTQYDTLFVYNTVHDTAWLTAYVHDTAFVNNYIHDTLWLTQTVWEYIHDTVIEHVHHYIHDTTIVNNYIHDTVMQYVNQYIHDTTFINNYIHDTVFNYINNYIHDTTFITNYVHDTTFYPVYIHDTTFVNNYIHDTLFRTRYVYDTTYINNYIHDTVLVYVTAGDDTTFINNYVHDTLYIYRTLYDTTFIYTHVHDTTFLTQYIHDTAFVNHYNHDTLYLTQWMYEYIHDTIIRTVTEYVHDTTFVNNYIHDTTYLDRYIYEYLHDTIMQYINHYIHDTTYINNYIHDTVRLTQYVHDTAFIYQYIHDTIVNYVNNYIHDTTFINNYIYDTIYLYRYIYDTVYIHDTIYIQEGEGIDNIALLNAKIYQRNGQIVVEGAEGYPVYLYDVVGRLLATRRETAQEVLLDVPASGAYLVKIGDAPARRIVVKR